MRIILQCCEGVGSGGKEFAVPHPCYSKVKGRGNAPRDERCLDCLCSLLSVLAIK